MPVIMDPESVAPCWAQRNRAAISTSEPLRIALVNNMPDSALEDTELQFCELLDTASGELPVHLSLFSLPDIARGERGQQHIAKYYSSAHGLRGQRFDGSIITGTEPVQPDLRNEPYWTSLGAVMDWAAENTASTVLSCLAAHAGVLHSDGVTRNRLADKKFGVFSHRRAIDHELTRDIPDQVLIPHSRWNEVREHDLVARGYTVLTKSENAGVDLFVKPRGQSLFVHFQGHPEYSTHTLLKEYRRDVRRYLKRERETYPAPPEAYFESHATGLLTGFRDQVLTGRDAERMSQFPDSAVGDSLSHSWKASAVGIYHNWLKYLVKRRTSQASNTDVATSAPQAAVHSIRD